MIFMNVVFGNEGMYMYDEVLVMVCGIGVEGVEVCVMFESFGIEVGYEMLFMINDGCFGIVKIIVVE